MAQGIDFMALARGRQNALDDNLRDIKNMQAQELYGFQREDMLRKRQEAEANRAATAYLAPMINFQQQAVDAGISEIDFLANQRRVILADPNYQAMSPEQQAAVLKGLGDVAASMAGRYGQAGDSASVQKIYGIFGQQSPSKPASDLDTAIKNQDILGVVDAFNKTNPAYQVQLSPDRQFVIDPTGTKTPINAFVYRVYQERNAFGGLAAILAQQQQLQQMDAAERLSDQTLTLAGFTRDTQGNIIPLTPPGSPLAAAGAIAGKTGVVSSAPGVTGGVMSTAPITPAPAAPVVAAPAAQSAIQTAAAAATAPVTPNVLPGSTPAIDSVVSLLQNASATSSEKNTAIQNLTPVERLALAKTAETQINTLVEQQQAAEVQVRNLEQSLQKLDRTLTATTSMNPSTVLAERRDLMAAIQQVREKLQQARDNVNKLEADKYVIRNRVVNPIRAAVGKSASDRNVARILKEAGIE